MRLNHRLVALGRTPPPTAALVLPGNDAPPPTTLGATKQCRQRVALHDGADELCRRCLLARCGMRQQRAVGQCLHR